jgi:hypothetical protein
MVNTVISVGKVWWSRRYHGKWELPDCGNGCLEYPEGYGSECSECLEEYRSECSKYLEQCDIEYSECLEHYGNYCSDYLEQFGSKCT